MIGPTLKRLTLPGAFMVFGVLCAVATIFAHGALAQEKPKPELLQQRAQEALKSDELGAVTAYARSVLELIARDPEVAEAILRAASAKGAQRTAALEEVNLLIKKKSPSFERRAAPHAEASVADVTSTLDAGNNRYVITITITYCIQRPDGTQACWRVTITILTD